MSLLLRSNTLNPGRPDDNSVVHLQLRSGRDRAQIKRWWNQGSNHKNYIDCSAVILDGLGGCQFTLVWPHNYDSRLELEWVAQSGTINFTMFRQVKHVALLCMDGTVLMHWVFGNRPGQKAKPHFVNDSCADGCKPDGPGGGGGCTNDNDCPPGYICQGGICIPDPNPGPDPPDTTHCWTIPELPTIDTDEELAERSVCLFGKCVDVPSLPNLGEGIPDPNLQCSSIPELPTIDTGEELAEKSVLLFDKCIDVSSLPLL